MSNFIKCNILKNRILIFCYKNNGKMQRQFGMSHIRMQDQIQEKPSSTTPEQKATSLSSAYRPDNMDKKFLVWTGKYKTVDDVPSLINREEMERCRSKIRIRVSNILMVLTLVGCLLMVRSGKKAAEKGETLQKLNLDWHKEYNEANKVEK